MRLCTEWMRSAETEEVGNCRAEGGSSDQRFTKRKNRFEHICNYLISRVTPVAFVTTKQRKAGLIPAKLPHETVALTVGRESAARPRRRTARRPRRARLPRRQLQREDASQRRHRGSSDNKGAECATRPPGRVAHYGSRLRSSRLLGRILSDCCALRVVTIPASEPLNMLNVGFLGNRKASRLQASHTKLKPID